MGVKFAQITYGAIANVSYLGSFKMINIDFSLAIASFTFIFLAIILVIWLCGKKEKHKDLSLDPRFIWFCSVCTYTFINTKEDTISTCPRCGSYNKKEISEKA